MSTPHFKHLPYKRNKPLKKAFEIAKQQTHQAIEPTHLLQGLLDLTMQFLLQNSTSPPMLCKRSPKAP